MYVCHCPESGHPTTLGNILNGIRGYLGELMEKVKRHVILLDVRDGGPVFILASNVQMIQEGNQLIGSTIICWFYRVTCHILIFNMVVIISGFRFYWSDCSCCVLCGVCRRFVMLLMKERTDVILLLMKALHTCGELVCRRWTNLDFFPDASSSRLSCMQHKKSLIDADCLTFCWGDCGTSVVMVENHQRAA